MPCMFFQRVTAISKNGFALNMKCAPCANRRRNNPNNPWIQSRKVSDATRLYNGVPMCGYCVRGYREYAKEEGIEFEEVLL